MVPARAVLLPSVAAVLLIAVPGCLFSVGDVRTPGADATVAEDADPTAEAGPSADAVTRQPVPLATDQHRPMDIALDDRWVYWTASAGVFKIAKDGEKGWYTKIYTGMNLYLLAVDATSVYVADAGAGQITKMSKDGKSVVRLAAVQDPFGIALDGSRVYYTNTADGALMVVPKAGGTPVMLARSTGTGGERLWGVAVDADAVYWTDSKTKSVMKVAKTGGTAQVLAARGSLLHALIVDDTSAYWREGDNESGKLMKVAKTGGTPVELATVSQSFPRGLAMDGAFLYWPASAASGGRVWRSDRDGQNPRLLASDQLNAHSIAVDATTVFWTNWAGATVMKLAK